MTSTCSSDESTSLAYRKHSAAESVSTRTSQADWTSAPSFQDTLSTCESNTPSTPTPGSARYYAPKHGVSRTFSRATLDLSDLLARSLFAYASSSSSLSSAGATQGLGLGASFLDFVEADDERLIELVLPFSSSAGSATSLPTDTPALASTAGAPPIDASAFLAMHSTPLLCSPGGHSTVSVPTPPRLKSAQKEPVDVRTWATSIGPASFMHSHAPWSDLPPTAPLRWRSEGRLLPSTPSNGSSDGVPVEHPLSPPANPALRRSGPSFRKARVFRREVTVGPPRCADVGEVTSSEEEHRQAPPRGVVECHPEAADESCHALSTPSSLIARRRGRTGPEHIILPSATSHLRSMQPSKDSDQSAGWHDDVPSAFKIASPVGQRGSGGFFSDVNLDREQAPTDLALDATFDIANMVRDLRAQMGALGASFRHSTLSSLPSTSSAGSADLAVLDDFLGQYMHPSPVIGLNPPRQALPSLPPAAVKEPRKRTPTSRRGVKSILKPARPTKCVRFDVVESVSAEELRLRTRALLRSPPMPTAAFQFAVETHPPASAPAPEDEEDRNVAQLFPIREEAMPEAPKVQRDKRRMTMAAPMKLLAFTHAQETRQTSHPDTARVDREKKALTMMVPSKPVTVPPKSVPARAPEQDVRTKRPCNFHNVSAPASGALAARQLSLRARGPSPLSPPPRPPPPRPKTLAPAPMTPSASLLSSSASGEPRRHSGFPAGVRRVPPPAVRPSMEKENARVMPTRRPVSIMLDPVHARISPPKRLQPLTRARDENGARRVAADAPSQSKGVSSLRSVLSAIPKAKMLASRVRAARA